MNKGFYIAVGIVMFLLIAGGLLAYMQSAPPTRVGGAATTTNTPAQTTERHIMIYAYDSTRDNGQCTVAGLVGVPRTIAHTNTPVQDAVNLLLTDPLTEAEKARGLATQFPLTGVALAGASQNGDELTLTFTDPQNATGGGSCKVSILRAQIEATAKQFEGVSSVRILPEDAFQP